MISLEVFENVSENKLIYTDIFHQYTTLIGKTIGIESRFFFDESNGTPYFEFRIFLRTTFDGKD
jgi:hypothetical protein